MLNANVPTNQHITFRDLNVKILNVPPFSTQKPNRNWPVPELEPVDPSVKQWSQIVENSSKNAKIIVWENLVEFILGKYFQKTRQIKVSNHIFTFLANIFEY